MDAHIKEIVKDRYDLHLLHPLLTFTFLFVYFSFFSYNSQSNLFYMRSCYITNLNLKKEPKRHVGKKRKT